LAPSTLKLLSFNRNLGAVSDCPHDFGDAESRRGKIQLKLPRALPQSFDIERSLAPPRRDQTINHLKLKGIIRHMQTITRWEPLREMEDFQNRLSNFSTLFGRPLRRTNGHGREDITLADWMPLADITEDEKEYLIKAELPELRREDVKVTVENGVLTISGERKFEKEEKKRKFHRVERGYGTFIRSFTLPDDADGNKVKAEFKNGLLTVHLPKSEHAKPKQIEVNVA
jgi:HSP20 family protein